MCIDTGPTCSTIPVKQPGIGRILVLLAFAGSLVTCHCAPVSGAELSADAVRQAIDRGVKYLKDHQSKNGSWKGWANEPGGVESLCILALLSSGVPVDDPTVAKGLSYVRKVIEEDRSSSRTYSTALKIMVLCAAQPRNDLLRIKELMATLEGTQIKEGAGNGAWTYDKTLKGTFDNSNTQFALLALHEGERIGVEVKDTTWRRSLNYFKAQQMEDGGWRYGVHHSTSTSGSMTCAGLACVLMASDKLSVRDAEFRDGKVRCCGSQVTDDARKSRECLERGLAWMGRNFSVARNPGDMSGTWYFYYMYGLERVGRLSGQRFLGGHDWYREGAEALLSQQDPISGFWRGPGPAEDDPNIATALALLFLSKGKRPVVISKLKRLPEDDWNRHGQDIAHLTRFVEKRWGRDLSWQVVDIEIASVADLLESPVIFISGRDALPMTDEQKDRLRQYVHSGGFLFVEACCDGKGFDAQFRELMAELLPDSPLRLLEPGHPVWYAETRVDPRFVRPLYGIDACCRTSVVYCPGDLSCYWELARTRRDEKMPAETHAEIDACLAMGANVLAYATGRQLKEKLDTPLQVIATSDKGYPERDRLRVAKLRHAGGDDDAPNALTNLLTTMGQHMQLRVNPEKHLQPITVPQLHEYPVAFLHGSRRFQFSASERAGLRQFIEQGGFVFADAICGNSQFADSFRAEFDAIFPESPLKPIPLDHPIFTQRFRGFDIAQVTLRDPQTRAEDGPLVAKTRRISPQLEGIEIDGDYAVIFSPADLSCALENHPSLECRGYTREDALRIGTNIIAYAMQQ